MSKHTPGPWGFDETGYLQTIDNGYLIYASPWQENACDGDETAIANAAFIVLAVNTHDDLVAALRDAVEHMAAMEYDRARGEPEPFESQFLLNARAALAKAEGKP